MNKTPSVEKIKDWLFPSMVTLLSFFLWNTITDIKDDISEMKKDIKTLMAQSNIDHTRIDGLERAVFKMVPRSTSEIPFPEDKVPELIKRVALIPKNELDDDTKI